VIQATSAIAAESYRSFDIAMRWVDTAMTPKESRQSEMQGECLLEQFPPCDVLVIVKVAQKTT